MPIFKKEGNQLVEYTQPSQITESLKPQGNTLFANLPTTPSQGDMYKVTDDFTTDNRFEEPNKEVKAPIFIYFNGTKWVLFASSGGDTHIIGTRNQCISWARQGMIPDGSVCIFTDDYATSTPYVVGTQAQINTMLNQGLLGDGTVCVVTDDYTEVLNLASNIGYDNTSSGLSSTRVQGAIDEINSDLSTCILFETVVQSVTLSGQDTVNIEIVPPTHTGYTPFIMASNFKTVRDISSQGFSKAQDGTLEHIIQSHYSGSTTFNMRSQIMYVKDSILGQ